MTHDEMVALIAGAVPDPGGRWADLGAGRGNFTRALASLLGPTATIHAVDRDSRALAALRRGWRAEGPLIHTHVGDFTSPLDLPPLDGILVANALHFHPEPVYVLRHVAGWLRPGGRLVVVEYDVDRPLGYVPNPLPWDAFPEVAHAAGFATPQWLGLRRSPRTGVAMYGAMAIRRAGD